MNTSSDRTSNPSSLAILLAEDNPVNQKVALRILKLLGYQSDVANNGQEVIKAIAEKVYDLILMDIQMPIMDGIEATRYIRNQEAESKSLPIGIIAMTANSSDDDQILCLNAGMNDYVSKPIQIDKLKNILHQYESQRNQ